MVKELHNRHNHLDWIDSLGAATFVIDQNHRVIYWNHACELLTGVESAEVLGTRDHWKGFYGYPRPCLADLVMHENWRDSGHLYNHITVANTSARGLHANNWCQTRTGNRYLVFEANALFDDDGNVVGAIETLIDATMLKKTEDKLQILLRAVESCTSSVIITDHEGFIEFVNPSFSELTGYNESDVIGRHVNIIRTEEDIQSKVDMRAIIQTVGEWKGELQCRRKDGTTFMERCAISCVRDASGDITHYVSIQDDVTLEYEMSEKLNYQARHDELTRLVNRREFEHRTIQLLDRIGESEHTLTFIDLDQFKVVNDNCGHSAGDELLRQVALIMQRYIRKTDTLARLGGDEFAILMENCSIHNALEGLEELKKAIEDFQFIWEGKSFRIGTSMGLVAINKKTTTITDLMKQADAACYMAKDLGRNRIHVYHPDDSDLSKRHGEMTWVAAINKALNEDRFVLYAQPIVPLDQSHDQHYEILVRMVAEDGSLIAPGAFMPAAERYNLVNRMDRWVISNTLELLGSNQDFLEQTHFVAINLSGQSLTDADIFEFIMSKFRETGVQTSKICFEITETATISHLAIANELITQLRELGCAFALDDFGSGLSSFGYLKKLKVDYLKIDGMFVKEMANDPVDYAMVKSINELGHVLNIKTIAEFVENDEIKGMLKAIGVNYGQGYGISRPLAFTELLPAQDNVVSLKR